MVGRDVLTSAQSRILLIGKHTIRKQELYITKNEELWYTNRESVQTDSLFFVILEEQKDELHLQDNPFEIQKRKGQDSYGFIRCKKEY